MTHFWKLSLIALVSLVALVPAITHAQDWDDDRIEALIEELEDFEDTFEDESSVDFDTIEDHFDEVLVYLDEFEIPEQQSVHVQAVSTSEAVQVMDTVSASYGTFTIKFDVTAIDEQVLVPVGVETESNGTKYKPNGPVGIEYALLGNVMQPLAMSAVVRSTADLSNGHYLVEEGETETFTLSVTVDPSRAGTFAVSLEGINYGEAKGRYRFYEVDQDSRDFWTEYVNIPDTASPTGSISTNSLRDTGRPQIISGTAQNAPTVILSIKEQSGKEVYLSGKKKVARNGGWSVKVPPLAAGSYTLTLQAKSGGAAIASGELTVAPAPQVVPATSSEKKSSTNANLGPLVSPAPTPESDSADEPLVLPVETGQKSSVKNSSLSASASVALEQLFEALEAYFGSR